MALSHEQTGQLDLPNGKKMVYGRSFFDNSYATGGESFAASTIGLEAIELLMVASDSVAKIVEWDRANSKVKASVGAAGVNVEETAAVDLSAVSFTWLAIGF